MKLNERSVAHYATCDSPPDKTGFLFKKGERNTAYHRRWFILKGNMLFYFEERDSREPIGVIVLEGCTVELCESAAEEFAFAIKFDCARARVYKMAAESQAGMESWVKALSRASFDYMRLVVRELERQLEDLQEGIAKSGQGKAKNGAKRQPQAPTQGPGTWTKGPGGVSSVGQAGSTNTPALPGPQAGEVAPPTVSVRDGSVAWTNSSPLANGCSGESPGGGGGGGGGGGVPTVSWEVGGRADGVRAPPVPPRRKVTGSLESPVSPETVCFSKLHDWYGQEVAELRVEWLQSQ
ncbi:sesquipedalian-1-like [Chanos chanos]|uniref:Sesquipedalian n=1 Tax=Chanos chanos TaxID=29144 RepID=A0A6J2WTK6_CHACN|nr:sesquipedalian-1-like [Chanos chanos]